MRSPSSRDRTGGAPCPLARRLAPHQRRVSRRAAHLLELCGEPLDEEADASLLGPDFLMHIMDVREELDAGPSGARLLELQQQNAAEAAEVRVLDHLFSDHLPIAVDLPLPAPCLATIRASVKQ